MAGDTLEDTVRGNIKRIVMLDSRSERAIALAAWPWLSRDDAGRRLRRVKRAGWPSAETVTELAAALGVQPSDFYRTGT